uniref:PDZ domain-containing protein n=1 Tax=Anopheles dirus TaxID=7168 RepID=A0A182N8I9_9DIPT
MKKKANIFELPPKCPALANKITGIFGWRHTYQVHQRQKGIPHGNQYHLYKSYSLNLPRKVGGSCEAIESGSDVADGGVGSSSGSGSSRGSASSSSTRATTAYRAQHAGTPSCETNPDSWVVVHHLQSQSGILDPEDHISDVADDREELIASYEDAAVGLDPGVQQGGGDGASGSSVGTGSPDIFQTSVAGGGAGGGGKATIVGVGGGDQSPEGGSGAVVVVGGSGGNVEPIVTVGGGGGTAAAAGSSGAGGGVASCIEVFANEPAPLGLGLQVRRGSEPSLHQIGVTEQRSPLYNVNPNGNHQGTSKRWSAAPFLGAEGGTGYKWMDAAEKAAAAATQASYTQSSPSYVGGGYQTYQNYVQQQQQQQQLQHHSFHSGIGDTTMGRGGSNSFSSKSLPRESTRKEPLGQAKASVYDSIREKDSEMLLVVNETGGPLGLTAIPDAERGGLLVQSVEPGSRAERGRLRRGDRILEINNIKLVGLSESSVQEHLKKSLASTELRLRVVRGGGGGARGTSAGRLVKSGSGPRYHQHHQQHHARDNRVGQMMIEAEEKPAAKVATVSPTRKIPGAPSAGTSLQVANTRKLGKRIEITLTKGDHGLGFSVTTRDNPAGGHCPIYIKNILPKGAAVEDGRLKPGDRLLEVEGIPMTGKSQTEVVSILRGTPHGATLKIVVSRQQELAVDVKEREIGFSAESEPKNSPPKPPPPVLPKSSLKQSNSSNSLSKSTDAMYGETTTVGNCRSLPKLSSTAAPATAPKTPTIQKKPLASILKSASTNHVAELLHSHHQLDGTGSSRAAGGHGTNGGMASNSNGSGVGSESLAGAAWKNREILTLHIPVHDTEKAGLGVSVKGKTGSGNGSGGSTTGSSGGGGGGNNSSSRTDGDLGIFVKSVLHGGAASRDGRLKMNDQLLSVNGVSLLGQSNAEAMDTLRRAMLQSGGSYPGKIILKIARRIGRPVSTGELLETMEQRNNAAALSNADDQPPSGGGTTVIYVTADSKQQHSSGKQHTAPLVEQPSQTQSKRYSNPVLDRLTGGGGAANAGSTGSLPQTNSLPHVLTAGSGDGGSSHYSNARGNLQQHHSHHHSLNNQRPAGGQPRSYASPAVQQPSQHGLRNESYYMATKDHWSTTSSATSLNGSNVVLIEEDPEPTSPTFHLTRTLEGGGGSSGAPGAVLLGNGNTSTPNGGGVVAGDATYASQLSLETNSPPSDAFSRDAVGRRSMSEKHHAAMDARETGTYQRNKKLREKRDRDSKLLALGTSSIGSGAGAGGSLESINLQQMARINSLKQGGGGCGGVGQPNATTTTAALAAHLLHAEAQDQLGDLGPSLGMKKSSSLESLQTMVQEIQMADEPRGPNALRTPRGRGREEILRAVVEQPAETQAKKHWLLEDGPPSMGGGVGAGGGEFPDGGFVSRNSPFQSSLNDGKGPKLRAKKSGGLLRGIGHMFRFGKHRKDAISPTVGAPVGPGELAIDYTGPAVCGHDGLTAPDMMSTQKNASAGAGANTISKRTGNQHLNAMAAAAAAAAAGGNNATTTGSSAASRYIVFDPNSVERSASSGVVYGHSQPPHYQPPPPPPPTGSTAPGTSIHHTDVFNHRYSHYVNYDELQQQISRRHHLYHSQRSARNTPPMMDMLVQQQQQQQQQKGHPQQQQQQQQQKYKPRPVSSYHDGGGGYETISTTGPPSSASYSSVATAQHRKESSSSSSAGGAMMKHEEPTGGSWNHHPATSSGPPPAAGGGGSIRNMRGPFVTQVKIQNHPSYQ